MSNDLCITLLGPLVVMRGEHPIPDAAWHSRQERRLLGILLTARGMRVPVDRLIDWLWPDAAQDAATVTLRSVVSNLRRALEPESGARAPSRYILTRPGGYAWNAKSGASIDTDAFLAHLQPAPAAERRTNLADRAEQRQAALRQAIDLYRGDYLADEPDAPWATALRESLRQRFLGALQELAELQIAGGEPDAAIELARRGLEYDRLHEPLYRVLMRAQTSGGDVAGALQSYERYRRVLDEELGATPSPQTQALHAAILRGELPAAHQPSSSNRAPPQRSATSPYPLAPLTAPLVGRSQEISALHGWIGDLVQGRGGVVAIVGEAGIGKTRLAEEALRVAIEQGALVIRLRCNPLERGLPFAPLSEALRPLVRAAPATALRRLPPAALAQVADLLPVLHERLPDLPTLPLAPPLESRNRLLDGLVDLALAMARDGPLVAWCDDAQWADEATLAVVGRLARYAPRRALLLLLAYRAEELPEAPALHELLRALGRAMLLRPLVLGRLDTAEVTQFLAGLAQVEPDRLAPLGSRLAASSGGNPLILGVAVQALLESHGAPSLAALLPDLEAGAPLPDLASAPQIRALVLARLERLPAAARTLLEQLAVIGRPVSLDLLEQLAGTAALEAAQTLLERQLLIEGADERLSFGHEIVRAIVVATLSSPRRRVLHRQAAEALAALHGERAEHAAELALHFGQSGHGAEAAVLRYATSAGDQARRAFGYRAALGHYDAALHAAERLGADADGSIAQHAFAGRLLTCEALLDWEGVMATSAQYERWMAQRSPAPPLVVPRRLVLLRALMGDLARAAAISAEQSRRQPEAVPAIHDMLQRTALILQTAEQVAATTRWPGFVPAQPPPGNPAADLPAILGPDEAALALFQVGWATLMQGLLRSAEPCLLRAYELASETGQAAVAVIAALQLAHLNTLRGEPTATGWLERCLDLAQQAPEAAWASIWPRIHQAFLLLLDDQYAESQARFELLATQLQELPTFQSHRASVEVGLALLALARGETTQAAARFDSALASPQLLYGFVYIAAQHGRARLAALRGDMQAARITLANALDYSAQRSLLPEYVRTVIEVARIERDFGDPEETLSRLHSAAQLATSAGLTSLAAAASALLARLVS
jgi:DNA-binding SARP family transcriptional activator